ncbi:MAG: hypothetical protein ACI4M3_03890, partial [Acutalibacteraceae bacterium]
MKKIAAVFAALVMTVCSFATVGAVPTDDNSTTVSETSEISDTSQVSDNSNSEQTSNTEEITYQKYTVENKNFEISLPSSMYVLSRDMDENDPALNACKTTKEEVNKSFVETDTYIRARSKDFSYDITIDIVSNDNTKGIDNLSALTEAELESLKTSILEQGVFSACTRTVYGKHLFLDLTFTQQLNDTKVYGMQEYTIVGGEKYTITFQSYNTPIDEEHKAIMKTIMESLTISSSSTAEEEQKIIETPSDTKTNLFNSRKFLVVAGLSVIGIAIFTALIVLTIKAKHNKMTEEEETDLPSNVEPVKIDMPKEQKTNTNTEKSSKVSTDDAKKILADIQSKAEVITSDIMEGNTQKRLQPVTPEKSTETVKKSEKTEPPTETDLTKPIKAVEEKKTEKTAEPVQPVVVKKPVEEKKSTEPPVSEYEKRFGKARTQTETIVKPQPVSPVVPQSQHIVKENDTIVQNEPKAKQESKKQEQIDEIKGFFRPASTDKGSETSQPPVKEVIEKQPSVPTAPKQEKKIEPV